MLGVLIFAKQLIAQYEGLMLVEYLCPANKRTIGYGKQIDYLTETRIRECLLNGLKELTISKGVADKWLDQDTEAIYESIKNKSYFKNLNAVRKAVIIDMIYNMGIKGFESFKKTIKALEDEDFELASAEMLDSKWAKQVGNRARENAERIRTGEFEVRV